MSNKSVPCFAALCITILLSGGIRAADFDATTRKDVLCAIDLGLKWLQLKQQADGHWSLDRYPAITAIVLKAYLDDPARQDPLPEHIQRGLAFIASCARADGGIYRDVPGEKGGGLRNYNTAACMYVLAASKIPKYQELARKALLFMTQQQHLANDTYTGGWGYDEPYARPYADIMNTGYAIEAIQETKAILPPTPAGDTKPVESPDANWAAARAFLQRCQNLASNETAERGVSPRPQDRGGLFYEPGRGMAGGEVVNGKQIWYSYGNATSLGLMCLLYCDVPKDDPAVKGVVDWLRSNYTLKEHPGLGTNGYYFYMHTLARGLLMFGEEPLKLANDRTADWRSEIAIKLLSLQRVDTQSQTAYWLNDDGRWMENDPVLVTAYGVMTLEALLQNTRP